MKENCWEAIRQVVEKKGGRVMSREVKFLSGHNCKDFPCKFDKKCFPENSHGIHGLEIVFYVHGEKGSVQFKLSTNWVPFKSEQDRIGVREIRMKKYCDDLFPIPTDLGYHSRTPMYEEQKSMGKCSVLGADDCYYDGSSLNCNDAFYVLINCGEEELWKFLEGYYAHVFENKEYPKVKEYTKGGSDEQE